MIKYGIYQEGKTLDDVKKEVDGTFGGRFELVDDKKRRFKFIAYTD